jgi:hypothetical protein
VKPTDAVARLGDEGRARAAAIPPGERASLLVRCWMSHDARWFAAAAAAHGLAEANRLNQAAAREEGRVEARRGLKACDLEEPRSRDDCIRAQEALGALLVPGLVDYTLAAAGDDGVQYRIERCFAHENVTRAGVAEQYECGVFARVQGWWDSFGLPYAMTPALGPCPKVRGGECAYTFTLGTTPN